MNDSYVIFMFILRNDKIQTEKKYEIKIYSNLYVI